MNITVTADMNMSFTHPFTGSAATNRKYDDAVNYINVLNFHNNQACPTYSI
jgi:hypothetical protein